MLSLCWASCGRERLLFKPRNAGFGAADRLDRFSGRLWVLTPPSLRPRKLVHGAVARLAALYADDSQGTVTRALPCKNISAFVASRYCTFRMAACCPWQARMIALAG